MKSTKTIDRLSSHKLQITTYVLALLLFTACSGSSSKSSETDSLSTDSPIVQEESDGILSLPTVVFTDTLTIDGKKHQYTIAITPDDSLPTVINAEGVKYHDNRIRLTVTQGADTLFNQEFTKQSFADYIEGIDLDKVALVNCRYNINIPMDHPALSFIAYVADPDDNIDVERNIEIRILAGGKYSLQAVDDPEMEAIDTSGRLDPEKYE